MAKHRSDLTSKENLLSNGKDREVDYKKSIDQLVKDKEDLTQQINLLNEGTFVDLNFGILIIHFKINFKTDNPDVQCTGLN